MAIGPCEGIPNIDISSHSPYGSITLAVQLEGSNLPVWYWQIFRTQLSLVAI